MRNRFLVCYDVSDSKRLARTYRKMNGFGDPAQYSVFICDLSPKLDFTHFKRHKRGNLQYDGTEWRGVSVHRSWRSIVKNPPTPTTSGYAQR